MRPAAAPSPAPLRLRQSPEAPGYRWVFLGAGTLVIGPVSVVRHSFAVFLVALTADRGWSRAATALGFTLFVIAGGLAATSRMTML